MQLGIKIFFHRRSAQESIPLTGNGSIIAAGRGGSGQGRDLNLQTGTLNIKNQAEVTVSSSGADSAGSLSVDGNYIYLNSQGSIQSDTTGDYLSFITLLFLILLILTILI
ncbi:MAG: hypothetical protein V7K57_14390 [Nostoc sp.]|uniref:hypothetical protein n=1 Tax=Nostoc sp. TaxID=1180 RepID=UPI002FF8153A